MGCKMRLPVITVIEVIFKEMLVVLLMFPSIYHPVEMHVAFTVGAGSLHLKGPEVGCDIPESYISTELKKLPLLVSSPPAKIAFIPTVVAAKRYRAPPSRGGPRLHLFVELSYISTEDEAVPFLSTPPAKIAFIPTVVATK